MVIVMINSLDIVVFVIIILLVFLIFLTKKGKKKKLNRVLQVLVALVIVLLTTGVESLELSDVISRISDLIQRDDYDEKNNVIFKENQNIDVKILNLNNEQIQIQIMNNDSTVFKYTDFFLLSMKNKQGEWKYMKFGGRNASFTKCVYELESGQTKTRSINWKDYFGHKLKKGKYRLLWIDELEFEIN